MFAVGALDELAGAALVGLVEANAPAATLGALKVLGNVFDKLASGDFAKFGTLKASAQALQAKLLSLTGGARALIALGFEADDAAGTYMWPDHDASAAASRAAAVRVVLRDLETLHAAIAAVGDSNSPAVATAAVNLMGTYLSNLLAQPTEERRRVRPRHGSPVHTPSPPSPPSRPRLSPHLPRHLPSPHWQIGGSNKALHARILSAHGGAALLAASGFVLSPATDTSGQPNAYTCAAPIVSVSLAFSLLARAGDVWAAMADEHAAAGRGGSTGGGGRPALAPEVPSAAVTEFRLEALPDASTIGQAPPPAADMQPALARADGGKRITLHAYQVRGGMAHVWLAQKKKHGRVAMAISSVWVERWDTNRAGRVELVQEGTRRRACSASGAVVATLRGRTSCSQPVHGGHFTAQSRTARPGRPFNPFSNPPPPPPPYTLPAAVRLQPLVAGRLHLPPPPRRRSPPGICLGSPRAAVHHPGPLPAPARHHHRGRLGRSETG